VYAAFRAGERGGRGLHDLLAAVQEAVRAREPLFPARAGAS
jgi:hypothetical protein